MSEEWVEGEDQLSSQVPTVSQWNQLVKRVGVISQHLEDARSALGQVAAESEKGIMNADLHDPDRMHNHLLTFLTGGTPVHPAVQCQADLLKLQKEVQAITMMKGLGTSDVDPSDPIISEAQATVLGLVSSIKTVKASLGGEAVRIENKTFHSAEEEMEVWAVENMRSDSGFPDFFYDVVSMLEAIQDSSKTSDEMLGSQAGSIKAGHKGLSASRMLNSFCVTVPQVLAKKGNGTEIYAASYDKWKSHDGRTGVVEAVRKSVENWRHRTESLHNTRFSSSKQFKALIVARTMMNESINFWTSMVVWADSFYNCLVNQAKKKWAGRRCESCQQKGARH
jgi:hypothetical protein